MSQAARDARIDRNIEAARKADDESETRRKDAEKIPVEPTNDGVVVIDCGTF